MNEIVERGKAAFRLLFATPGENGALELPDEPLLKMLSALLEELDSTPVRSRAGVADYCNALVRLCGETFAERFCGAMFDSFVRCGVFVPDLKAGNPGENGEFLLDEAKQLITLLLHLNSRLPEFGILPAARRLFAPLENLLDRTELMRNIAAADCFSSGRCFRFVHGKFIRTEVESAKELNKFYGYPGVRSIFRDHFRKFHDGETNIPLLINSLPGYGKTSMTVSFAMAIPDAVLILPAPEALESQWLELMTPLIARSDRKFVVFFDDIDPRSVDWYNFRTHVGGAFALPSNVIPVLSANFEFPASILSRGRRISYPIFDEVRCTEMVEDFLRDFGLKTIPGNLVSLIAADYTEEFGQKKFTELSPRTLMRYLNVYRDNQTKRRTMIDLALGPMIQKPDNELFYEFNIELMRSLYGEEYIQRLLKERLRNL